MKKKSKKYISNKKNKKYNNNKKSKLKSCCKTRDKDKKCIREDSKIFDLPRKFSKKKCLSKKIKGFSMRSSCDPYKNCKKN